ncbi:hypothetical protein [Streptomyces sp. JNUCC 63]
MRRHLTGRSASVYPRARVGAASGDSAHGGSGSPEERTRFLRALRSPRPLYSLDDAVPSDPLTTTICWFTGTASASAPGA